MEVQYYHCHEVGGEGKLFTNEGSRGLPPINVMIVDHFDECHKKGYHCYRNSDDSTIKHSSLNLLNE
jgi:hypothetical protein